MFGLENGTHRRRMICRRLSSQLSDLTEGSNPCLLTACLPSAQVSSERTGAPRCAKKGCRKRKTRFWEIVCYLGKSGSLIIQLHRCGRIVCYELFFGVFAFHLQTEKNSLIRRYLLINPSLVSNRTKGFKTVASFPVSRA
jgi:hypothetical protein